MKEEKEPCGYSFFSFLNYNHEGSFLIGKENNNRKRVIMVFCLVSFI